MQRFQEPADDSNQISATMLHKTLRKNYFKPFIASLKKSQLNEREVIQEIFVSLQNVYARSSGYPITKEKLKQKILHDLKISPKKDTAKHQLFFHADLKQHFIRLGLLYLNREVQKKELPQHGYTIIQTCIREMFHDYLNPLPAMQITMPNMKLLGSDNQIEKNGVLFNTPVEIQRRIYSYLNYQNKRLFKSICKSAYFLHKAFQEEVSILYMIGHAVEITPPRKFKPAVKTVFRDSVSEREVFSSLQYFEKFKVFSSFYQALEYITVLRRGIEWNNGEVSVSIPALWTVMYRGHVCDLPFIQQKIVFNKGDVSDSYSKNHREAYVSYAKISRSAVQLLFGAVIAPGSNFANYKVFNQINLNKYISPEQSPPRKHKCILM